MSSLPYNLPDSQCSHLSRIHVLPLSSDAMAPLINRIPTINTTVDIPNSLEEPLPILRYFSKLLHNSPNKLYRLSLHETFYVSPKLYVVVDMESSPGLHIRDGFLAASTLIFTSGLPIEPLTSLHLCLVRSFSYKSKQISQSHVSIPQHTSIINPMSYIKENQESTSSSSSSMKNVLSDSLSTDLLPGELLPSSSVIHVTPDTTSTISFKTVNSQEISSNQLSEPMIINNYSNNVSTTCPLNKSTVNNSQLHPSDLYSIDTSILSPNNLLPNYLLSNNHRIEDKFNLSSSSSGVLSPLQFPIVIHLLSCLQESLKLCPAMVFIRGREIELPCPHLIISHLSSLQHQYEQQSSSSSSFSNVSPLHTLNHIPVKCVNGTQSPSSIHSPIHSLFTLKFFVTHTSDQAIGIVIPGFTTVHIELDPVCEFERIHISPIADTIPAAYQFDFFNSYIRPFLDSCPVRLFFQGDLFSYHGVQFKLQRTQPSRLTDIEIPDKDLIYWKPYSGLLPFTTNYLILEEMSPELKKEWESECQRFLSRCIVKRNGNLCCRIGQLTRIHRGEPISLHWIDLLPVSVVDDIRILPTRLQPFALMHAIGDLAPQDLLRILGVSVQDDFIGTHNEDMAHQNIRDQLSMKIVEQYATNYQAANKKIMKNIDSNDLTIFTINNTTDKNEEDDLFTCVVCLEQLTLNERVLELPCSHVFHVRCVVEWLKRSILCPICKRDLRDFLS